MKVCIIGNSHVASLKLGWEKISSEHADAKITFFASRANGLSGLRLEGDSLIPSNQQLAKDIVFTSGGLDRIDIHRYDIFITYGLGLAMPLLQSNLSAAVKAQACQDVLSRSLNLSICNMIQKVACSPIYIGHHPQLALNPSTTQFSGFITYQTVYSLLNSQVKTRNLELVKQPEQTLADNWHTKPELSVGSKRLDVGDKGSNQLHPEDDYTHMNGDFGRIWLDNFFSLVKTDNLNL